MGIRGVHLPRIWGIQIIIDYSWFIIFFLVMYTFAESYFPKTHTQLTTPQYWIMGMVAAILLFVSVLLHELAHSFVAIHQGIQVESIRLFIFGGVAQISSEPASGRNEFLIALAGPACSMVLGFAFLAIYVVTLLWEMLRAPSVVAMSLASANIALALFNLIPGFPLDGGRILRAILWDRWNDLSRATKVVSQIGNYFALFLIVLGVLQFLVSQNLVYGLWLIFIGLFMKQSSLGSYQTVLLRQALSGVQVRQIMTVNVVSVDWLTSVETLVKDFFYRHQFTAFPAFDRDELVGMVSLSEVKSVPKELWPFKQVRDIMTPIEHIVTLKPADDATEALRRMISEDVGRMPVVDEGRLVGVVSRRDIMNLFRIKSDLGLS